MGFQRSGTNMLLDIFDRDWRSTTFPEMYSEVVEGDSIRLKTCHDLQQIFKKQRGKFIVLKGLGDLQHAATYLQYFPNAKVIWLFRSYMAVVGSALKAFSSEMNLINFINTQDNTHWVSEYIAPATMEMFRRLKSKIVSRADAAALIWYVRNMLFFDLRLEHHERVKLCKYEDLVERPNVVMREIYNFIQMSYPNAHITKKVSISSKESGKDIELTSDIEAAVKALAEKLDIAQKQSK